MMNRLVALLCACCVVLSVSNQCVAGEDASDYLLAVVGADLNGDPDPRVGRVEFSSTSDKARYEKERRLGDRLPEAYSLEVDPLVIVEKWKAMPVNLMESGAICLPIEFVVVGKTKGKGVQYRPNSTGREIEITSPPIKETVAYCAIMRHAIWVLIDPPIPRVLRARVVALMREKITDLDSRIDKLNTRKPEEEVIRRFQTARNYYIRQLAVLEQ
jgi:hypothetical protein